MTGLHPQPEWQQAAFEQAQPQPAATQEPVHNPYDYIARYEIAIPGEHDIFEMMHRQEPLVLFSVDIGGGKEETISLYLDDFEKDFADLDAKSIFGPLDAFGYLLSTDDMEGLRTICDENPEFERDLSATVGALAVAARDELNATIADYKKLGYVGQLERIYGGPSTPSA